MTNGLLSAVASMDVGMDVQFDLHNRVRLDIACGSHKQPGWAGIDVADLPGVDIVHDLLSFPWPIPDESVSEARMLHYLEHIPMLCMCCRDQKDPLLATFDELYRILAPGATVFIECPHALSVRSWQDPTHRRAISENTFSYANAKWREEHGVEHYDVSCNFSLSYGFVTDGHGAVQDIQAQLTKLPMEARQ